MKQLNAIIAFLVMAVAANAQSVITLQRGTTTKLYTYLDSAIANAQNGDVIYLPGGQVATSNSGPLTITKKVSIFGTGYRADSSAVTQPTTIAFDITFSPGSEGSLLTGVSDINNIVTINCINVSISRCNYYIIYLYASGAFVEENVIAYIYGDGTAYNNNLFRKNLIYYYAQSLNGSYFVNNNFLGMSNGWAIYSSNNIVCSNNIFLGNGSYPPFYNSGIVSAINNLFTNDWGYTGNKVQSVDSIFTKYPVGAGWDLSQNFKLKTGCKGIKGGSDGTDIGIYGTASPFKSSAFPFNPHIQSVSIPGSTGLDGKLNISITVAAQNQ